MAPRQNKKKEGCLILRVWSLGSRFRVQTLNPRTHIKREQKIQNEISGKNPRGRIKCKDPLLLQKNKTVARQNKKKGREGCKN
jgi:hypothetical protein